MLEAHVGSAAQHDAAAAAALVDRASGSWTRSVRVVWADGAYRGDLAVHLMDSRGWRLDIVTRRDVAPTVAPGPGGFQVLRHRWIVERTLAWASRFRRAGRDHEARESSSRAWVQVGLATLMLARATRPSPARP